MARATSADSQTSILAARDRLPGGRRIDICGPAGAGKSTLARFLADHGARPIREPDPGDRSFGAAHARDPERHGFEVALDGLVRQIHERKYHADSPDSLVFDPGAFQAMARAEILQATEREARILARVERLLAAQPEPDLIIRLTCPEPLRRQRLAARGREGGEAGPESEFALDESAFEAALERRLTAGAAAARLLRIDSAEIAFAPGCPGSRALLVTLAERLACPVLPPDGPSRGLGIFPLPR